MSNNYSDLFATNEEFLSLIEGISKKISNFTSLQLKEVKSFFTEVINLNKGLTYDQLVLFTKEFDIIEKSIDDNKKSYKTYSFSLSYCNNKMSSNDSNKKNKSMEDFIELGKPKKLSFISNSGSNISLNIKENLKENVNIAEYIKHNSDLIEEKVQSHEYFNNDFNSQKKCEIFEKEVNLLKSLILINSLNINSTISDKKVITEDKKLINSNKNIAFDNSIEQLSKDEQTYKKIQLLSKLNLQIIEFSKEIKEIKKFVLNFKNSFLFALQTSNNKVLDHLSNEIRKGKALRSKVINIDKLL